MNRKQLAREMFPTTHRETWSDYLWYCLLFGTAGSAFVGGIFYSVDKRHTFFLYVCVGGFCIMAALFVGRILYGLLRVLLRHQSGGV